MSNEEIKVKKELDKILKENNTNRPVFSFAFIVVLVLVSIAYASIAINLGVSEVKGATEPPVIRDLNWKVIFENVREISGSVQAVSPAKIDSTETNVNFSIDLKEPGEYYSFNVDIANRGNRDAIIHDIKKTELDANQSKYLKYIVTYEDGSEIKVDDTLDINETKTLKVVVEFDEDVKPGDLPSRENEVIKLSYAMTFFEK